MAEVASNKFWSPGLKSLRLFHRPAVKKPILVYWRIRGHDTENWGASADSQHQPPTVSEATLDPLAPNSCTSVAKQATEQPRFLGLRIMSDHKSLLLSATMFWGALLCSNWQPIHPPRNHVYGKISTKGREITMTFPSFLWSAPTPGLHWSALYILEMRR